MLGFYDAAQAWSVWIVAFAAFLVIMQWFDSKGLLSRVRQHDDE